MKKKGWDSLSNPERRRLIDSIHWYKGDDVKVIVDADYKSIVKNQPDLGFVIHRKIKQRELFRF